MTDTVYHKPYTKYHISDINCHISTVTYHLPYILLPYILYPLSYIPYPVQVHYPVPYILCNILNPKLEVLSPKPCLAFSDS